MLNLHEQPDFTELRARMETLLALRKIRYEIEAEERQEQKEKLAKREH